MDVIKYTLLFGVFSWKNVAFREMIFLSRGRFYSHFFFISCVVEWSSCKIYAMVLILCMYIHNPAVPKIFKSITIYNRVYAVYNIYIYTLCFLTLSCDTVIMVNWDLSLSNIKYVLNFTGLLVFVSAAFWCHMDVKIMHQWILFNLRLLFLYKRGASKRLRHPLPNCTIFRLNRVKTISRSDPASRRARL